jgi:hypothetical protein
MEKSIRCEKCKQPLAPSEAYEYRGVYSCAEHFELVCKDRDRKRQQVINEERGKTDQLSGLDLSSSNAVGKANRELLKRQIEIASKESPRLKEYEGRTDDEKKKT